jgi:hypothetical protein
MKELTIQQLIKTSFSGEIDQSYVYLNLMAQAGGVLIAGIVMWRLSAYFHKKKIAQRQNGQRFETRFSREWKKND